MAWRRPGDKPLSEPMMVRLPTHICVTRPQWVNLLGPRGLHNYIFPFPDSKVHGATMGPIWGRQDPCGPHVGPINFAIWFVIPIRWKLHFTFIPILINRLLQNFAHGMIIVLSLHMKNLPQYVVEKWDYNKTYCASYLDHGWKTINEMSH